MHSKVTDKPNATKIKQDRVQAKLNPLGSSSSMSLNSFSSYSNIFWVAITASSLYLLYTLNHPIPITPRTPMSTNPPIDPYQHLRIVPNPNGTISRLLKTPSTPPSSDLSSPIPVLSKDIAINQSNNTWLRLFLPRKAMDQASSNKLPLIVFFHGDGFILLSAASSILHDFCANMANDVAAIVASVDYRLAPEHRLPAAYDDAMEALHWIKTSSDPWLTQYADYFSCYLMGSSAGGNIAYHAGLRAAVDVHHLGPLKIRGLILIQPFFGGTERTASELRLVNDPVLPLCVSDLMWELSLPSGVDRDHEYCNPTGGDGPGKLDGIKRLGWRVLVTGCDGDPLVDRQMRVMKLMEEKGMQVVGHFRGGDYHGIQDAEPVKAKQLNGLIKIFLPS